MYTTGKELLECVHHQNQKIWEVVIAAESESFNTSPEEIWRRMEINYAVMKASAKQSIEAPEKYMGNIIGGDAVKANVFSTASQSICGQTINRAMSYAFSCSEVNASMGKICAAPTAGSCGILPAAMLTLCETKGFSDQKAIEGLFTAAGIGEIIARHATLSGAEGGCQAECGSAAAMAAAAMVEMMGGTAEQALSAASIALKNILGLVCDPIAGLVEAPCAKRNASGVVNAMLSADMALAGIESIIPFDEVVGAMYAVGKSLPMTLRETALGGIAVTETAQRIAQSVLKK